CKLTPVSQVRASRPYTSSGTIFCKNVWGRVAVISTSPTEFWGVGVQRDLADRPAGGGHLFRQSGTARSSRHGSRSPCSRCDQLRLGGRRSGRICDGLGGCSGVGRATHCSSEVAVFGRSAAAATT